MPAPNRTECRGDSRSAHACGVIATAQRRCQRPAFTVALAVVALGALLGAMTSASATARADPEPLPNPAVSVVCDDAFCTPGVKGDVVLGAPCGDTTYYVFGTTSWGRLVFCGSPRRYEPRYFRAMPMLGVKELGSSCAGHFTAVAQAPDGLFLTCVIQDNQPVWVRGDT